MKNLSWNVTEKIAFEILSPLFGEKVVFFWVQIGNIYMQCTFSSFTGEIFKKRPFFTCWSRRNEMYNLKSLKIAKLSKDPNIPKVRNICFLSLLVPSKQEREIYKLRQLSLSQFVYFLSTEPSIFKKVFCKSKQRGWTKKKYTGVFKSGGNILGQSASKH